MSDDKKKQEKKEKSKPPKKFTAFVSRFPELGSAWELMQNAEKQGPFDERTQRLIKLAIAIGAQKEGATHSCVRKGLAAGLTAEEMEQIVALAASTLGMPAAVAAYGWIQDEL